MSTGSRPCATMRGLVRPLVSAGLVPGRVDVGRCSPSPWPPGGRSGRSRCACGSSVRASSRSTCSWSLVGRRADRAPLGRLRPRPLGPGPPARSRRCRRRSPRPHGWSSSSPAPPATCTSGCGRCCGRSPRTACSTGMGWCSTIRPTRRRSPTAADRCSGTSCDPTGPSRRTGGATELGPDRRRRGRRPAGGALMAMSLAEVAAARPGRARPGGGGGGRQARRARARPRRHPRRRPRAARGPARRGEDAHRPLVRAGHRHPVRPGAVHAGPHAVGHHRARRCSTSGRPASTSGPGPVFTSLLLGDEINRATPKTQAALLEAMQERQVTAEGRTHPLERPFLVLATQNPIEYEGTYPLPEAQLDRFLLRIAVGYPSTDDEVAMLERRLDAAHGVGRRCGRSSTGRGSIEMQDALEDVHVSEPVRRYIVDVVTATRQATAAPGRVQPRGSLALLGASRARAVAGRPGLRHARRREGAGARRAGPPGVAAAGALGARRAHRAGDRAVPRLGAGASAGRRPVAPPRRSRAGDRRALGPAAPGDRAGRPRPPPRRAAPPHRPDRARRAVRARRPRRARRRPVRPTLDVAVEVDRDRAVEGDQLDLRVRLRSRHRRRPGRGGGRPARRPHAGPAPTRCPCGCRGAASRCWSCRCGAIGGAPTPVAPVHLRVRDRGGMRTWHRRRRPGRDRAGAPGAGGGRDARAARGSPGPPPATRSPPTRAAGIEPADLRALPAGRPAPRHPLAGHGPAGRAVGAGAPPRAGDRGGRLPRLVLGRWVRAGGPGRHRARSTPTSRDRDRVGLVSFGATVSWVRPGLGRPPADAARRPPARPPGVEQLGVEGHRRGAAEHAAAPVARARGHARSRTSAPSPGSPTCATGGSTSPSSRWRRPCRPRPATRRRPRCGCGASAGRSPATGSAGSGSRWWSGPRTGRSSRCWPRPRRSAGAAAGWCGEPGRAPSGPRARSARGRRLAVVSLANRSGGPGRLPRSCWPSSRSLLFVGGVVTRWTPLVARRGRRARRHAGARPHAHRRRPGARSPSSPSSPAPSSWAAGRPSSSRRWPTGRGAHRGPVGLGARLGGSAAGCSPPSCSAPRRSASAAASPSTCWPSWPPCSCWPRSPAPPSRFRDMRPAMAGLTSRKGPSRDAPRSAPPCPEDLDEILALVRELAEFEELADEVAFDRGRVRRAPLRRPGGRVGADRRGGRPDRRAWRCGSRPSRPSSVGPASGSRTSYVRPEHRGQGIGTALLHHLRSMTDRTGRVERARLERAGDRGLPRARRPPARRMDHLPVAAGALRRDGARRTGC